MRTFWLGVCTSADPPAQWLTIRSLAFFRAGIAVVSAFGEVGSTTGTPSRSSTRRESIRTGRTLLTLRRADSPTSATTNGQGQRFMTRLEAAMSYSALHSRRRTDQRWTENVFRRSSSQQPGQRVV